MTARVGTIISRNHAPEARVLSRSLREHHPELRLEVLVVDHEVYPGDLRAESFDLLRPSDIGVDPHELHALAAIYNGLELCEALKPRLLRHLISDADAALYLDTDIELFTRIDDLIERAAAHSVLLTPHVTEPLPVDDIVPTDDDLARTGIYNAGFLGIGRAGEGFLEWWWGHLERHCLNEAPLFGDQIWLSLVPAFFDHAVVRDPGCNVARWNLSQRRVERGRTGAYLVNGAPLRFFHYSYFDPYVPHLLHVWGPEYRYRVRDLSGYPELETLCRRYAAALMACGYAAESRIPYGWARTAGGLALDRRIRRLFRDELMAEEAAGAEQAGRTDAARPSAWGRLPDPFSPNDGEPFVRWLRAPRSDDVPVSRYLHHLYDERVDLQSAFPELRANGDPTRFVRWARIYGPVEASIPPALAPDA